jgi:hypothetical protein
MKFDAKKKKLNVISNDKPLCKCNNQNSMKGSFRAVIASETVLNSRERD